MKYISSLYLLILGYGTIWAQDQPEYPDQGEVSAKIYTHFNYSLDPENRHTAFEVKRAYFGYTRSLNDRFSGKVKLDIGSPDDVSEFSLIRRYTYFKNACLSYHAGHLTAWFGLFDMMQFKVQEKFWGYRYLYKSFMDAYRFGPSADLGVGMQYKPSDRFSWDVTISNGEGYKNLQFDNVYKIGGGMTMHKSSGITLRLYYAIHAAATPQMTISGFAGYETDRFRIGGEYNHQMNYLFNKDHDRYGYSIHTTFTVSGQWAVFARYDQIYSNTLPEQNVPWNLAGDGSAIVTGCQFTPMEFVHVSLNYRDWVEYARNGSAEPFIYLNMEIVF